MHRMIIIAWLSAFTLTSPVAHANGRFPASVSIRHQPGNQQVMLASTTYGLLISKDAGASFQWICENAVGYGGTFDPVYAITRGGKIFATTFEGLRYSADDGCTWETVSGELSTHWVGAVEIGPDGRIWAPTSSGGIVNDVYVSADGDAPFVSTGLRHDSAWWKSIRIAPGDPDRLYLSGYLVSMVDADGGVQGPQPLLYRTEDGGVTWVELDVKEFQFGSAPQLMIEGVSPSNPDLVFARSVAAVDPLTDYLYRSTDKGETWTKILEMPDTIRAFHIRPDGTMIVGTALGGEGEGVRLSHDSGDTWVTPTTQPLLACVSEREDGTLFGCASNWAPDYMHIARSEDAMTWTRVVRISSIDAPLSCPVGTIQHDTCEVKQWPGLVSQFGIGYPDAGVTEVDARPDIWIDAGSVKKPKDSCGGCSVAFLAVFLVFPRRLRRRRHESRTQSR